MRSGQLMVRPGVAAWSVALTAFVVRLLHVLSYESAPTNDMSVYVEMAVRRLTLENLFSMEGLCWLPPGYSLFLKPFFLLFQEPAALLAVKIAQAALGAWSCLLVYRMARRMGSTTAGLAAALLTCFYPHFIFYTSAFMSETLFTTLYLASLVLLLRAFRRPTPGRLYRAGLLAGAALLVRPVALSLAPAFLAVSWRSSASGRGRARGLALALAGVMTLAGPWAIRNWIATDHLVVVAPNGPFNLAVGNHPQATGRYTTPPSIDGTLWSRMEDFRGQAADFVTGDPAGALFVTMRLKWLALWETIPPWPLYSSNPQLFLGDHFFPFVSWRIVFVAGWVGLGLLAARGRPGWWIPAACLACYLGLYLVFFGNARFRLPAEGLFLAWAGVAVALPARRAGQPGALRPGHWSTLACLLLLAILLHSGMAAAATRAGLESPEGLLASGDQFPILTNRDRMPLFGEDPLPVDRSRGRFLRLGMQIYRMGPHRDVPDNGFVRLEYLDGDGRRLRWTENPTLFLEALPADRWVPVAFRAHIPPRARSVRAYLVPQRGSPDTVIVDRPILRYSPGNDLALESLFPYLRYAE